MSHREYATRELAAAVAFWSRHHSVGSRRRIRKAIAELRAI